MSMSSVREVAVELAHSTGCVPYARGVSGITRRAGAAQTQSNRKHGWRAHTPPPEAGDSAARAHASLSLLAADSA